MNINKDLILKVAGIALTMAGTVVTGMVSKNENEKTLEKLVEEKLNDK